MLDVTVTLPDGRPAVVHSESLGYDLKTFDDAKRAELVDTVRHNYLMTRAEPHVDCPALRAVDPDPEVRRDGDRFVWVEANVLCTAPFCRAGAEAYEAELGEEHPAAARLREWAAGQGVPA